MQAIYHFIHLPITPLHSPIRHKILFFFPPLILGHLFHLTQCPTAKKGWWDLLLPSPAMLWDSPIFPLSHSGAGILAAGCKQKQKKPSVCSCLKYHLSSEPLFPLKKLCFGHTFARFLIIHWKIPHLFCLLFQYWSHLIGWLADIYISKFIKMKRRQMTRNPISPKAKQLITKKRGLIPILGETTKSQAICKKREEEKKQYGFLGVIISQYRSHHQEGHLLKPIRWQYLISRMWRMPPLADLTE